MCENNIPNVIDRETDDSSIPLYFGILVSPIKTGAGGPKIPTANPVKSLPINNIVTLFEKLIIIHPNIEGTQ